MSKKLNSVDEYQIRDNVKKQKNLSKEDMEVAFLFSKRLNDIFEEREIEQDKFSDKINISTGGLSNYRNGKRVPNTIVLNKIAKELNVSLSYLCGMSKSKNESAVDISNTIGLDDESIIQLARYKQNNLIDEIEIKPTNSNFYSEQIELLNIFIKSGVPFLSLLTSVGNYIKDYNKLIELKELLKEKNEFELAYNGDKNFIEKKALNDNLQIQKFKIQDDLFKLIEKYAEEYKAGCKTNDVLNDLKGSDK